MRKLSFLLSFLYLFFSSVLIAEQQNNYSATEAKANNLTSDAQTDVKILQNKLDDQRLDNQREDQQLDDQRLDNQREDNRREENRIENNRLENSRHH